MGPPYSVLSPSEGASVSSVSVPSPSGSGEASSAGILLRGLLGRSLLGGSLLGSAGASSARPASSREPPPRGPPPRPPRPEPPPRLPRPVRLRPPGPARRFGPAGSTRPWISAFRPRTRPVIGEAIIPTSWPWSTSSGGSFESASSCSTRQGVAVHQAALERQQVGLAPEGRERLRRKGDVAAVRAHERERGRSLQHLLQRLRPRLVGGALGQRVLHDPEARARLGQPRAQLGGLRHRDPSVVDGEHRLRLLDLAGHLLDGRRFLFSVHLVSLCCVCQAKTHGKQDAPGVSTYPGLTRARRRRSWAEKL